MTARSHLAQLFGREGHRLTGQRRTVAEIVATRSTPFTAAEVAADPRARRLGVGRATVFRTLDLLGRLGAIEQIDLPGGRHAWVACEVDHHHHVVCRRCGQTRDVDDAGLRDLVGEVAARTGFRIEEHRLELFGLCPGCAALEAGP